MLKGVVAIIRSQVLQAGLEVINNTNLMYFSAPQKAEFYTLKGMFHTRFGWMEEANLSFGQAVQMDMGQAKSWAEWGRFNDRTFKDFPTDMSHAANAVSCYLQAAGRYKNAKSRPLLARVL
jgi:transformation/transcription domain-associated protein